MQSARFNFVLTICLALCACQAETLAPSPVQVRVTMIPNGQDPVLDIFANKMDAQFVAVESTGGVAHVAALEKDLADAALVQADVAYTAFTSGTTLHAAPHKNLRAMAAASVNAMHLVLAPGVEVKSLRDLHGLHIGADRPGTNTELTIRSLFPKIGIPVSTMRLAQYPSVDVPLRFADGTLDAAFIMTRYPASMVQNAMSVEGSRLVSLTSNEIVQLREQYPFFRAVTIPVGIYGQAEAIRTVGINMVFVCREDLDEQIVYDMLNAFFTSLPALASRQPGYRGISMDQAAATPIPLHAGAARFFRERQVSR